MACALGRDARIEYVGPRGQRQRYDLLAFLTASQPRIRTILETNLRRDGSQKWYAVLKTSLVKYNQAGEEIRATPVFRSNCFLLFNEREIPEQLEVAGEQMLDKFSNYMRDGSGWALDRVIRINVHIAPYRPLAARGRVKLPEALALKRAILNIKSRKDDKKCFVWCILAALFPVPHGQNGNQVSKYAKYEKRLKLKGIDMPVSLRQIPKFERQNRLHVNVYHYPKELEPLYVSPGQEDGRKLINLLMIKDRLGNAHYCLITDLNRLLFDRSGHVHRAHYCTRCLNPFGTEARLKDHQLFCNEHRPQRIRMPEAGKDWLFFKNYQRQQRGPFALYMDLESLLLPIHTCAPPPDKSYTEKSQRHVPCAFCYVVVSTEKAYCKPPKVYRGEDVIEKLIGCLLEEE